MRVGLRARAGAAKRGLSEDRKGRSHRHVRSPRVAVLVRSHRTAVCPVGATPLSAGDGASHRRSRAARGRIRRFRTSPRYARLGLALARRRAFVPGLERAIDSGDMHNSVLGVTEIGVALRRYRLDRGSYPDELSALVPAYLARLPIDPVTGRPPAYARSGAGFTLKAAADPERLQHERGARVDRGKVTPGVRLLALGVLEVAALRRWKLWSLSTPSSLTHDALPGPPSTPACPSPPPPGPPPRPR